MAELPPIDISDPPEPAPVIPLRAPATLGSELKVVRGGSYCAHRHVLIDDNKRTVECGDCEAQLDAFQELSKVAHRHERIAFDLAVAKRETKALQGRIDLMKRLEANARQRLKRLVTGELPQRYEFDALIDDTVRVWASSGKVTAKLPALPMLPDVAREFARKLIKLAREAERA